MDFLVLKNILFSLNQEGKKDVEWVKHRTKQELSAEFLMLVQ